MSYLALLPLELNIKIWKLIYQESIDIIKKNKLVWLRKTVPIVLESHHCVKSHGEYIWYINDADMYEFECCTFDDFDMVFSNIVEWGENNVNNYRSWLAQINNQWYISKSYETIFEETMLDQTQPYLANQPIDLSCTYFDYKRKQATQNWETMIYWKEQFQTSLNCIAKQSLRPIVSTNHPPLWKCF